MTLQEHEYTNIQLYVSFLEIYNEELEDLFTPEPSGVSAKKSTALPARKTVTAESKLTLVDDPNRGNGPT